MTRPDITYFNLSPPEYDGEYYLAEQVRKYVKEAELEIKNLKAEKAELVEYLEEMLLSTGSNNIPTETYLVGRQLLAEQKEEGE